MRHIAMAAIAAIGMATSSGTLLAQTTGGIPADPNSRENRQPGPTIGTPADPEAGSSAGARTPTAPTGAGGSASTGAGTGEAGAGSSPAGIPADPTTDENLQPGPGISNPADPAAGSAPGARVPTDPERR